MNSLRNHTQTGRLLFAAVLISTALILFGAMPAAANDKMEASQLIEKAQLTLQSFMCDDSLSAFRDLMPKADGILIVPSLLKGAYVVGVSGGNGLLVVRDKQTGRWSDPAFYTIAGASIGFQIGGQSSEVILLAMTDRGVKAFQKDSFKLGGDVGIAVGPVGLGASAATANLSADIIAFSRSQGLYGGISLDGTVVAVRDGLNIAYYGKDVSPADIFMGHVANNAQTTKLTSDVAKSASGSWYTRGCKTTVGWIK